MSLEKYTACRNVVEFRHTWNQAKHHAAILQHCSSISDRKHRTCWVHVWAILVGILKNHRNIESSSGGVCFRGCHLTSYKNRAQNVLAAPILSLSCGKTITASPAQLHYLYRNPQSLCVGRFLSLSLSLSLFPLSRSVPASCSPLFLSLSLPHLSQSFLISLSYKEKTCRSRSDIPQPTTWARHDTKCGVEHCNDYLLSLVLLISPVTVNVKPQKQHGTHSQHRNCALSLLVCFCLAQSVFWHPCKRNKSTSTDVCVCVCLGGGGVLNQ